VTGRLLVVGDSMLDRDVLGTSSRLCPEQPVAVLDESSRRSAPGGAALAAALLARDGHDVVLFTAIGRDEAGCELSDLLAEAGVTVVNIGLDGATPEKVRFRSGQHLLCRVDRGQGVPRRTAAASLVRLVGEVEATLVADYGRGLTSMDAVRSALSRARILVWDPHPRGAIPVAGAAVVTPNESEAGIEAGGPEPEAVARDLLEAWGARAVCITRGARGALLRTTASGPLTVTVGPVGGDPCGAGDRFAASLTGLLAAGVQLPEAVRAACEDAASFVSDGGWHGGVGRAPDSGDDVVGLARSVQRRGGSVVATGGCFDLLHAGHVEMLQSARRLGDCLVVLLNSDASVERLKGPGRPLVGEDDRAAILRSLACVDAVFLFDEDTPQRALRHLRPDLFVKGGDYDPAAIPEAETMRSIGGRVATVPYVSGRSSSGLIERAVTRVA
jgi:D-beta-D-heptose 7-phosphate kinase / D-beta-D-heptose 1-phosphate adenosyltransferase